MMTLLIPPPVWMIATGFAMWVVTKLPMLSGVQMGSAFLLRSGLIFIIVGIGIEVIAIVSFFRAKTTINPLSPDKTKNLVTTGLNRFSRNPMYLGMVILLSGWMLRLGNPLNLGLLIAFVVIITQWQIKPEEKSLREKFGDEYDRYCARVRRWI